MGSKIIQNLLQVTLAGVVKWLAVVGLLLYIAFAVVIIRQVRVMSEAIDAPLNPLVRILTWLHLGLAILLVVVTILVL